MARGNYLLKFKVNFLAFFGTKCEISTIADKIYEIKQGSQAKPDRSRSRNTFASIFAGLIKVLFVGKRLGNSFCLNFEIF